MKKLFNNSIVKELFTITGPILPQHWFNILNMKSLLITPAPTNKVSSTMMMEELEQFQPWIRLTFLQGISTQHPKKLLSRLRTWLENSRKNPGTPKKWHKSKEAGCHQEIKQFPIAWDELQTISRNQTFQLTTFKQVWIWTSVSRTFTQKMSLIISSDMSGKM